MLSLPEDLKRMYKDRRLLVFVGAGVSMGVEWKGADGVGRRGPSWGELVDQAALLLGFDYADLLRVRGTDLQILEFFMQERGRHTELANWLVKQLTPPEDALRDSEVHQALAALGKCESFYTTNFDDFLERALVLNGRNCRVVVEESDLATPRTDCEVVKFHGDLNHPNAMVISESHYEGRLGFETALDYKLKSDLLARAALFIGYSFRDPNVAYLFRNINKVFQQLPKSSSGRRAYIIVPNPSRFEVSLFGARNMMVLPVEGQTINRDVATILRSLEE